MTPLIPSVLLVHNSNSSQQRDQTRGELWEGNWSRVPECLVWAAKCSEREENCLVSGLCTINIQYPYLLHRFVIPPFIYNSVHEKIQACLENQGLFDLILNTLDKKVIRQIKPSTIIVPLVRTLPTASFFTQNSVFMKINGDDALCRLYTGQIGCNCRACHC